MTAARTQKKAAVFDADAARAARLEALGEPFRFTFGGQEFTLPGPKEWPIEAVTRLSEGDLTGALVGLLGADQYRNFALYKPTVGDVEGIMGAVAAWQGISLGE